MFQTRTFALPDGEVITFGDTRQGEADTRPVLLLLPGQKRLPPGQLSGDFIAEQVDFLLPEFRVIMWNYRFNDYPGEKINIPRLAQDLVAFLAAEKIDQVCLYGYSYGGMVAIRLASLVPQKIKAMVLLNAFPYLSFTWFGFNRITLRFLLHLSVIPSNVSSHIRESMYPSFRQHPNGYHGIIGRFCNWLSHHALDTIWIHIWSPRIWSALKDDVRPLLPSITAPTLILGGRADAACSLESAREFKQGLPNSQLEVLDSAGHYTVRIWPESFNRPIRSFLVQQYGLPETAMPIPHRTPPAPMPAVRLLRTLVVQYWEWLRSRFR
ncbi:MAG: alpha/beta hydrolase [Patescibacteria group bacterium]